MLYSWQALSHAVQAIQGHEPQASEARAMSRKVAETPTLPAGASSTTLADGSDSTISSNAKGIVSPELLIVETCGPDGVKHDAPVPLGARINSTQPVATSPDMRSAQGQDVCDQPECVAQGTANPLDDPDPEAGCKGRIFNLRQCGVPDAANDHARASWMKLIGLMNEPPCPELDVICKVMCDVFAAPYGCITLFEDHQVWISNYVNGTPSRPPFKMATCPWTFLTPHPMGLMIEDICKDARFAETVWVERGVRAYVSSPLVSVNGHRMGTICFVDVKPRQLDACTARFMNNLAELAVRELEKFLDVPRRLQLEPEVAACVQIRPDTTRSLESITKSCVLLVDTTVPGMRILYAGNTFEAWTGCDRSQVVGKTLLEVLDIAAAGAVMASCNPPSAGLSSLSPTRHPSTPSHAHRPQSNSFGPVQGAAAAFDAAVLTSTEAADGGRAAGRQAGSSEEAADGGRAAGRQAGSSQEVMTALQSQSESAANPADINTPHTGSQAASSSAFGYMDSKSAALWRSLAQDTQARRRFILSGVRVKSSLLSQPVQGSLHTTTSNAANTVTDAGSAVEPATSELPSATPSTPPLATFLDTGSSDDTGTRVRQHVQLLPHTSPHHSHHNLPMFDLSFRPAALDRLDQDTYEVSIPTWLQTNEAGQSGTQPRTTHSADATSPSSQSRSKLHEHVYAIRLHRSTTSPQALDANFRLMKFVAQLHMKSFNSNAASAEIQIRDQGQLRTTGSHGASVAHLAHTAAGSQKATPQPSIEHLPGSLLSSTGQQEVHNSTAAARAHASKPNSTATSSGVLHDLAAPTAASQHSLIHELNSATSTSTKHRPKSDSMEYLTASNFSTSHDAAKLFMAGNALELARTTHGTVTSSSFLSEDEVPLPFYGRTVLQAQRLEQSTAEVFSGLSVGHTIGRGGYAVVLQANWHDTQVAVKVQDHVFSSLLERKNAELEISIGQQLAHPNVLRTLAYASALLLADPAQDRRADYARRDSHAMFAAAVGAAVTAAVQGAAAPPDTHHSAHHTERLEELFCAMLLKSCDSFASYRPSTTMLGPGSKLDGLVLAGSSGWNALGRGPTFGHAEWLAGEGLQGEVITEEAGSGTMTSTDSKVTSAAGRLATTSATASQRSLAPDGPTQPPTTSAGASSTAVGAGTVGVSHDSVITAGAGSGLSSHPEQSNGNKGSAGVSFTQLQLQQLMASSSKGSAQEGKDDGQQQQQKEGEGGEEEGGEEEGSEEEWPTELVFPQRVRTWVVMEFGDGGTLQDAIDRGWFRCRLSQLAGPDMLALLRVVLDIARGLDHLHEHGIVHADLSGFNVILCSADGCAAPGKSPRDAKPDWRTQRFQEQPDRLRDGSACVHGQGCAPCRFIAKISDFGKAFRLASPEQIIRRGEYGTMTHMAPEVLRDQDISQAGDVYSLGVLMWSLYTGARPWAGLSHALIMSKIVIQAAQLEFPTQSIGAPLIPASQGPAPGAAAGVPTDDDWYKELAVQCMAREPGDRPHISTVRAVIEELHTKVTAVLPA